MSRNAGKRLITVLARQAEAHASNLQASGQALGLASRTTTKSLGGAAAGVGGRAFRWEWARIGARVSGGAPLA